MTDPTSKVNEIAQAYEKNFALLEAARDEYEKSALSLLEEITAKLNEQFAASSLDEGLRLDIVRSDQGFARRVVEHQLIANEGFSRLRVLLRMAVPWGGSPRCLQIAVVAHLDDRTVTQTLESLRQTVRKDGTFDDLVRGKAMKTAEPTWLHAAELEIDSDTPAHASQYLALLLHRLTPLALAIDADCSFNISMRQSLEKVLQSFKSSSPFPSGWSFQQKVGWWQGMHFVQLNRENVPSFWVGYRVATQCLMYGHHEMQGDPSFAKRFLLAAKAKPPESFGGFPAGLVQDKDELESKLVEEIDRIVAGLFQLFYATINGSASLPGPSESDTTAP